MKRYLICILLFILLPVIFCDAKAVIVFEETVFNFGKVNKESTLKHTFNFKNTGSTILIIERIKAG